MLSSTKVIVVAPSNAQKQARVVAAVLHFDILSLRQSPVAAQHLIALHLENLRRRLEQAEMEADLEMNSQ